MLCTSPGQICCVLLGLSLATLFVVCIGQVTDLTGIGAHLRATDVGRGWRKRSTCAKGRPSVLFGVLSMLFLTVWCPLRIATDWVTSRSLQRGLFAKLVFFGNLVLAFGVVVVAQCTVGRKVCCLGNGSHIRCSHGRNQLELCFSASLRCLLEETVCEPV
jgi:hypothetical protein